MRFLRKKGDNSVPPILLSCMCISFLRGNFRDALNDLINKIKRHVITNPVNCESVFFVDVSMVALSEILLLKCAQFREQGELIDVHLKVGEELFSAHRIVLAASNDYFGAMFAHEMKESNQEVIELKDESISTAALKIVLDFIYSGDLQVNDENIFEVLVAADHLQVTSVVQQCCDYLQTQFVQLRFDVHTYCQICTIANRHGMTDLQEATRNKMASMYKDVCGNSMKNYCPILMLINILTFSVEITLMPLQRHSSSNPLCSGSNTKRGRG